MLAIWKEKYRNKFKTWSSKEVEGRRPKPKLQDFHKWVSLNIVDWQDNIVLTAVPRSQISQQIQIWQRSTVTELSSLLASWASCFGWVIVGATADTRPRLKKAARSLRAGNAGKGGCCRGVIKSNHLRQHFYRSKCLSIYPSIKNTFILNQKNIKLHYWYIWPYKIGYFKLAKSNLGSPKLLCHHQFYIDHGYSFTPPNVLIPE